jgi:UDP-N-acetyl-D-galactosamine dehydrogenase
LIDRLSISEVDVVILAVSHDQYKVLSQLDINKLFGDKNQRVIMDLKGLLDKKEYEAAGYCYWRM